jgi:DNA polymerase-3 subunit delta'
MSWDKVLNQKIAKEILKNALKQNKVSGTYLFYGSLGTGKWALALELAKALNCEKNHLDPCDSCFSCIQISKLTYPDLKLIFPLPSTKTEGEWERVKSLKINNPYAIVRFEKPAVIAIEKIRETQKEIALKPFQGEKKVVIISEAQNIRKEGANALLKTLEEPPSNTVIILTSSSPNLILPTILSRCQKIRLANLPMNLIKDELKKIQNLSLEKAGFYAKISQGSYGLALDLISKDKEELREKGWELVEKSLGKKDLEIVDIIEQIEKEKSPEEVVQLGESIVLFFRDLLWLSEKDESAVINSDKVKQITGLLKFFQSFEKIEKIIELASQIKIDLQRNVSIKLSLLNFCINLKKVALWEGLE